MTLTGMARPFLEKSVKASAFERECVYGLYDDECVYQILFLLLNIENPRKWQNRNLVSGGHGQAWAGHELGGSAPHQCRSAPVQMSGCSLGGVLS
jgi:hypothetical protein